MLDDGRYGSVTELAAGEKFDRGYLGKVLMLTLLVPDMVEVILDGTQPEGMTLPRLLEGVALEWGATMMLQSCPRYVSSDPVRCGVQDPASL